MNSNIITFQKSFLIPFLNYQFDNDTTLKKFYLSWLRLNLTKPPKSYIPKPSSRLELNQVVIKLPNWSYPGPNSFFLSFEKQKEFEKIVNNSFDVIVFNTLFSRYFNERLDISIEEICNKYNVDIDHMETIRMRFHRLRKNAKK